MRSLEAQRPAFEAYQKCLAEHRREVDLHYAADNLIRLREQRQMMEAAFLQDPKARERYPGGVKQIESEELSRYRSLGGTASTTAEVRPIPSPCPTPGPVLPQRPASSEKSAITERRSIVVQPR